jgi:hypothetical protein
MAISYVNVTFLRDWPFGPLVFPSGMTCSLPEEAGKGAVAAGSTPWAPTAIGSPWTA